MREPPTIPKPVGHCWRNNVHPNPELQEFRRNLPIAPKREEVVNVIDNAEGE